MLWLLIEDDKVNQGRLRKLLKRQIISLFTGNLGRKIGCQYELIYNKVNADPLHISNFMRREISKFCFLELILFISYLCRGNLNQLSLLRNPAILLQI